MKILFTSILLIISFYISAQVPQQISYQAVARNSSGQVIQNQTIGVKLDLRQGTATGAVVFSETHSKTTNQLGLFTLGIGSVNTAAFSSINWENGPYFLEVSIDPNGGSSYTSMGTQQLLSVPYALYAKNAGGVNLNAGNGISINSGTITNTAPNQTVNISGSGVTGSYPNYTISAASTSSTNISAGNANLIITQSGTDYTLTPITPTLDVIGGSISGAYPNQTLTVPTGVTYTNGSGISITSGSVITNTAPDLPVTLIGNGGTTVSGSYPNYTVTSASSQSTTLIQGNNISLNQSGNSYTVSSITPTLNVVGGTITGAYPNQTLTVPAGVTYTNGSGISITSGSVITNTAPNQTVNISGAGATSILGTYPNYTVSSIVSPSTTLVQGSNVILNQSGNTYTVAAITPTISAGSGINIGGTYPNISINSIPPNYFGTFGNINVTGFQIDLANSGVTAGQYGANATNAVPTFSVDAFGRLITAAQYTPTLAGDVIGSINTSTVSRLRGIPITTITPTNGQVLTFNSGTLGYTAVPSPTLNYVSGLPNNTLTVGSNTVSIPNSGPTGTGTINTLPLWTGTNTLGSSVVSQNVGGGIIMTSTTSPSAAPRLRVKSDDYAFMAEDMSGTHTFAVRSNIGPTNDDGIYLGTLSSDLHFMTGNSINPDLMVLKRTTNRLGIGTKIPSSKLHVVGNTRVDSSFIMNGISMPFQSLPGQGKIFFDNTSNRFMVSENGGVYQNLLNPSPWTQGAGVVNLTNVTDKVGIGIASPAERLEVAGRVKIVSGQYGLTHTDGTTSIGTFVDGDAGWFGTLSVHPLYFFTDGDAFPEMTIMPGTGASGTGNVGINNNNPSAKLEVNGNTKLNGPTTIGTNGTSMNALIQGSIPFTTPNSFNSPGISSPFNFSVPNVSPGDRVFLSIKPSTQAVTYRLYIAMCTVSVAGNIEFYLGSVFSGTVPGGVNITIDYLVIKP